jgi:DNA-directed RNA polymerase subunit RPC12/RpoP
MSKCQKCGRDFGLFSPRVKWERTDRYPEFYNKVLCSNCHKELAKTNKECPKCGKKFGILQTNTVVWRNDKFFPEYRNKIFHKECGEKLQSEMHETIKKGRYCYNCVFYDENVSSIATDTGVFVPNISLLTIQTYHCKKFDLALKTPYGSEAEKCTSYLTPKEYKEKALRGEMEQRNVQLLLDFSSLKDVMLKGGLVMTAYKCPNCSGMVDIPEAGKVLVCKYCGSTIKPVDIFEKIKTLIQ